MKKFLLLLLPFCAFATKITLWHGFQGFLDEKFQELIHDFEENSEHTVELKQFDNYNTLISEALDSSPTAFMGYEVAAASLIDHPDLLPLHELDPTFSSERSIPSAVSTPMRRAA